jgi:hypothetical protein
MPSLGLIKRKEIWVPTLRGWAFMLILAALVLGGVMLGIVPFLAITRPVGHGILVVEGWLPDYALEEAKGIFEGHPYRMLVTTGVPIEQGTFVAKETNYAQLAATTLKHLGVKPDSILPLGCAETPRNRTFATARRFREWLDTQSSADGVDIYTLGVHARRSRLLYQIALGPRYPTGIIAGTDQRYDQKRWWLTSSGVKTIITEVVSYVYTKLFFYPTGPDAIDPKPK